MYLLHGKYNGCLVKVGGAQKLQYTFNMAPLKHATSYPLRVVLLPSVKI